jgi:altronate hydrolase
VVGSAVAPVIKITGNSDTFKRMEGDMDFDAGGVLSGECTLEDLTVNLMGLVNSTASGSMTKSEALGHKEYCIPYKYQDKEVLPHCCC